MTLCTICGEKYDCDPVDGRCILCRNKTARTTVIPDKATRTQDKTRDLHADLALCDAATPGYWKVGRQSPNGLQNVGTKQGLMISQTFELGDATFIAEARQGWPEAIRRAIAAEAEVERLREVISCAAFDLHYADHYSSSTTDVERRLRQEVDGWEGTGF